jgi:hypothetical protein
MNVHIYEPGSYYPSGDIQNAPALPRLNLPQPHNLTLLDEKI